VFLRAVGPEHELLVYADTLLGTLHREGGDLATSLAELTAAAELAGRVLEPSHGGDVNTRIELAKTLVALGEPNAAAREARTAIARIDEIGVRKAQLAEAQLVLARALGPGDAEALDLATAARDAFAELGDAQRRMRVEADAWLARATAGR
jgi:hypothetical protein